MTPERIQYLQQRRLRGIVCCKSKALPADVEFIKKFIHQRLRLIFTEMKIGIQVGFWPEFLLFENAPSIMTPDQCVNFLIQFVGYHNLSSPRAIRL